jgi:hypothetical protein
MLWKEERLILIAVTFVAFLVAYALGVVVVKTVDRRLSEISINMPTITLPKNHISVNIDDHVASISQEHGQANYTITPKSVTASFEQKGGSHNSHNNNDISASPVPVPIINPSAPLPSKKCLRPIDIEKRAHFDSADYKSESGKVDKPSVEVPTDTRNVDSYPASYPQSRLPVFNLPKRQLVPTYYRNPADMTREQILKFKSKAKFNNMTVQDYENWLLLFYEDPQNLESRHRSKLNILLKGGRLDVKDLPQGESPAPPLTAEGRFHKNYPGYITNLPHSDTGPQYAYNFDDYDSYTPPSGMKHLTLVNPDESLKTGNADIETRPLVVNHKQR